MRIFLDANILFSAAKSEGAIRRLLGMLIDLGHECVADGYVVEEARRNLAAKYPDRVGDLDGVLSRVKVAPVARLEATLLSALPVAEKDRPVLAGAIRLDCDALVTGDRTHFGALYGKSVRGVAIHSPRSLAEALVPLGNK